MLSPGFRACPGAATIFTTFPGTDAVTFTAPVPPAELPEQEQVQVPERAPLQVRELPEPEQVRLQVRLQRLFLLQ